MVSFIFIDKGPVKKKLHHTCLDKNDGLDIDDSDEDCTIDYEIVRFSA
jgi:hypothetical protein